MNSHATRRRSESGREEKDKLRLKKAGKEEGDCTRKKRMPQVEQHQYLDDQIISAVVLPSVDI